MRWTTLLDEPVNLTDSKTVFEQGERVIASKPTARILFETWELNHWDPHQISFEADVRDWLVLPASFRSKITRVLQAFIIGEHTGLDLLSPVLAGAPSEVDLRFLATQVADEARHSVFMFKLSQALWPDGLSEKEILESAWRSLTPSYRSLNDIESSLARATLADPANYDGWIRQVTMFHFVTEGVLAYYGQQSLTRVLEKSKRLPGIKQGFSAMGRDEARHVSFGLGMLREGIQAGKSDEILDVLRTILPFAVTVDYTEGTMLPIELIAAHKGQAALLNFAHRRLVQIGLDRQLAESFMRDVGVRANKIVYDLSHGAHKA